MKVIIVAAGKTALITSGPSGFPPNSKPKCLFHVGGETILERQVRIFRKFGLKDIRIVIGYKKELIEDFIRQKNLGLEIVENPDAIHDHFGGAHGTAAYGRYWAGGLKSVKVGLKGINDDVLIIYGDVLLYEEHVKFILEHENPEVGWSHHMHKISKEKLPLLRNFQRVGGTLALCEFMEEQGGIFTSALAQFKNPLIDIDVYSKTDESRGIT